MVRAALPHLERSSGRVVTVASTLGLRALLAATLATLMTGCVAGMLGSSEGVLLIRPS